MALSVSNQFIYCTARTYTHTHTHQPAQTHTPTHTQYTEILHTNCNRQNKDVSLVRKDILKKARIIMFITRQNNNKPAKILDYKYKKGY